ncbi:hypothetical protein [Paenibacillus sp. FSL H8-0537]|uniref:hypothetical protein n=1 Tax=Paenibacillus sp. FSL H8-0537 TaxID=2921399 RepID=UPI003100CEFF
MRYFKDSLWTAINSGNIEAKKLAKIEWKDNTRQYLFEYMKLEKRLPREVFEHFLTIDFHDYRLKEYKIIHNHYGDPNPIQLFITVTKDTELWTIEYNQIKKLNIDVVVEEIGNRGMDDWGYHELLIVDEKTISHEILFASGSTILIYFLDNGISVRKEP